MTTKHKLNPGSVASYDLRPGNGVGLFWWKGKGCHKSAVRIAQYCLAYTNEYSYCSGHKPHLALLLDCWVGGA